MMVSGCCVCFSFWFNVLVLLVFCFRLIIVSYGYEMVLSWVMVVLCELLLIISICIGLG